MPTEGRLPWLTFIGHVKDSLWSLDLFRCESVALRTYWVVIVMDQYTRRIIGFGIYAGVVIKNPEPKRAELKLYRWQAHCRGLYQTPIAA
jgi:hypothetical protein